MDEDIDNDNWGQSNEEVWYRVVKMFRDALSEFAIAPEVIDVGSRRYDPYIVDAAILSTKAISHDLGLRIANSMRSKLGTIGENWTLRVWIDDIDDDDTSEAVIWLEVDRYRVAEFLGKSTAERFASLSDFTSHYWSPR